MFLLILALTLSVQIDNAVSVQNSPFTLAQIAEINGQSDAVQRVGSLKFSPKNGFLTRDEVVSAIQKSGASDVKIELRMPERVKINSPVKMQKGDVITLFANIGGIVVEQQGEAMQNGAVGDKIRVRNISSKKVVSGIIRAQGRVEVLQ